MNFCRNNNSLNYIIVASWKRDADEFFWTAWSHCDAECGLGHEYRQRQCVRKVNFKLFFMNFNNILPSY